MRTTSRRHDTQQNSNRPQPTPLCRAVGYQGPHPSLSSTGKGCSSKIVALPDTRPAGEPGDAEFRPIRIGMTPSLRPTSRSAPVRARGRMGICHRNSNRAYLSLHGDDGSYSWCDPGNSRHQAILESGSHGLVTTLTAPKCPTTVLNLWANVCGWPSLGPYAIAMPFAYPNPSPTSPT